jgi:polyvinyl alcohol dehydrogenase (cytochrome)
MSCRDQTAGVAENLFNQRCASCHVGNGQSMAPAPVHLANMSPRSIFISLESGKMKAQGDSLSREEKIALAEFLTQRKFVDGKKNYAFCREEDFRDTEVKYAGWGGNQEGTGFVSEAVAGLSKKDLPGLNLKWAFGFEGGAVTRNKVTVIGDHIIFGSEFGEVYCLNMETGCVRWVFEANATIRGGIAVSEDIGDRTIAYFSDFGGNTFAVNVLNGELIWQAAAKNDPNNAVTGTPVYYDSLLYVPMSSMEVVTAGRDSYACCRSSGQVVALDAETGEVVWRHRVIGETATERGINAAGVKKYGPSGAPVWCSPTVDAKRGRLYIGTGENNSNPPTLTSDALQALDLKTGALIWNHQATPKDAYISACDRPGAANCPDPPGPDVDFGMAPILTTRTDGSEVLVVGQKSGVVHCLDPDTGQPIWQTRIGRGGALGGIHWGMATDGQMVYAANSDWWAYGGEPGVAANPGLFALDLMQGEVVWKSTSDPGLCRGKSGCYNSNSSAPTLIPGLVFAGGLDGHFRAYDADDGQVLWDFDTNQSFETVNGVKAHGGSIDGPGPTIADGMVFINSGYALFGQMPGNVLLAFGVEED